MKDSKSVVLITSFHLSKIYKKKKEKVLKVMKRNFLSQ